MKCANKQICGDADGPLCNEFCRHQTEPLPVDSIDWLACPKCAKAFDVGKIEKQHIGTLYESYKCWGCGLMSPTLTAGSLKRWWNKRAG